MKNLRIPWGPHLSDLATEVTSWTSSVQQAKYLIDIPLIDGPNGLLDDLHVLLRHRPRSISLLPRAVPLRSEFEVVRASMDR